MATLIVTPLVLAWRGADDAATALPKSTSDAAAAAAVALKAVLCIHVLLLMVPLPCVLGCSFPHCMLAVERVRKPFGAPRRTESGGVATSRSACLSTWPRGR